MKPHPLLFVLAVAAATPQLAAAQQAGPSGQGGAPGGVSIEAAIPLTPGMIRDLGKRVGENRRAQEEVMTQFASPASRRVNVAFTPGQTTPIIHVVKGYPTAVSFFDRTGAPWPIEWDTNSNPAGVAGGTNCNANPTAGGPAVAAV